MANQVAIDRERIERVVREVVNNRFGPRSGSGEPNLIVNTSARHMHISQEHLEILFGKGAELTKYRDLYQTGEFAADQTVDLVGPRRRMMKSVRILGPTRPQTQLELSFTDAISLGIDIPVRMSGKLDGTPGILVLGPEGYVMLNEGVIRAQRHVHMTPDDAQYYGVAEGDRMDLIVEHHTCAMTIHDIMVRVNPKFKLEVHVDTDEGNCCDLRNATSIRLAKQNR